MFKKITLIVISTLVLASTATASDDLFEELVSNRANVENFADAPVEIDDMHMDIDVDNLSENADGEDTDAVEACFRRFGYRSWGHRGYGYSNCYRSYGYNYSYYRPLYCAPVYHRYCAPTFYWGCH